MNVPRPTDLRGLDAAALAALIVLVLGWFWMTTLVTQFGDLQLRFHFYQLWSVLENPTRLLSGSGDGDTLTTVLFGGVCLLAALAVFLPYRVPQRSAWLASLAPLALMLVCAVLLHQRTSGDVLVDTGRQGNLGSAAIAFANQLAGRLTQAAATHIRLGLGAYVSFAASAVLAWRGLVQYRARAGQPRERLLPLE